MDSKADFYFTKAGPWQEEINLLRTIVDECHLTEDLKWGVPCYTYEKKNIVLIHVFKAYCAFLFFKGVLLKDTKNILIQQTENVQSARQIRFTSLGQIVKMKATLKNYIFEAVALEESGAKVELKKTNEYSIPEEFQKVIDKNDALKKAFYALSPGRQRAYLLHFSAPKQSKTRESRIKKSMPQIVIGKGLNDL